MAGAVAAAIESDGHAAIQAGTGTGKSLAYLVPVASSGRRTVIATATKALQDQLAGKDLPFLAAHVPGGVDFAVLKGRSNYLCLQRLDEADGDGGGRLDIAVDDDPLDPATVARLRTFAATSATGDRAELDDVDDRTWRLVSVGRDECPGASRCPRGDDCLAARARARAAAADVLVVNLHLYAIDVTTDGMVLPDHDIVIVDEAHQLEDVVAQAAGVELTPGRLTADARSAGAVLADREAVDAVEEGAGLLHERLGPLVGDRLAAGPDEELGTTLDLVTGNI